MKQTLLRLFLLSIIRQSTSDTDPRTDTGPPNAKWKGLIALVLAFTMWGCGKRAAAGQIFCFGFLDSGAPLPVASSLDAFRQELSKLGWIEGKNITIEYRFAERKRNVCLSLRRTWFVLRLI